MAEGRTLSQMIADDARYIAPADCALDRRILLAENAQLKQRIAELEGSVKYVPQSLRFEFQHQVQALQDHLQSKDAELQQEREARQFFFQKAADAELLLQEARRQLAEASGYLGRMLRHRYSEVQVLPDLMGVIIQIDNGFGGALRTTEEKLSTAEAKLFASEERLKIAVEALKLSQKRFNDIDREAQLSGGFKWSRTVCVNGIREIQSALERIAEKGSK